MKDESSLDSHLIEWIQDNIDRYNGCILSGRNKVKDLFEEIKGIEYEIEEHKKIVSYYKSALVKLGKDDNSEGVNTEEV